MHVSREVDTDGDIDDRGPETGMGDPLGDVSAKTNTWKIISEFTYISEEYLPFVIMGIESRFGGT